MRHTEKAQMDFVASNRKRKAYVNRGYSALSFVMVKATPILTPAEELDLLKRCKTDSEARDRLVTSNLRFVARYVWKYAGYGLDIEDLMSLGVEGLIVAIDKFNWRTGYRLCTYAVHWIQQRITRYIFDNWSLIRLKSVAHRKLFWKLRQRIEQYTHEGELDREAFAASFGIQEDEVDALTQVVLFGNSYKEVQLDVANDDDPFEDLVRKRQRQFCVEQLTRLPSREQDVLTRRMSDDDDANTLYAIGTRYDLSRERIRQIESIALNKLRDRLKKQEDPR